MQSLQVPQLFFVGLSGDSSIGKKTPDKNNPEANFFET